jgi:hypothetical protein
MIPEPVMWAVVLLTVPVGVYLDRRDDKGRHGNLFVAMGFVAALALFTVLRHVT